MTRNLGRNADSTEAPYRELALLGDSTSRRKTATFMIQQPWKGQVLCSEPERAAFSWWDYRMNAFKRRVGLRIDLILLSESLAPRRKAARIDVEPRRLERPSDHTPVIAEIG